MKIGKLSYLNNAPMYYALARSCPHFAQNCQIVEGPPSYLNQCIQEKKIDLSVISSIEYARNYERYLLLPDLSISSDGPVQSVLLMSRVPMNKLHGQLLLLSSDSETSVALIKIILAQQGIEPVYVTGKIPEPGKNGDCCPAHDFAAFLVIGDMAMQLNRAMQLNGSMQLDESVQLNSPPGLNGQGAFPFVYDLGEEWKRMTRLPFVFALWVVRKEVQIQEALGIQEAIIQEAVIQEAVIQEAAGHISVSRIGQALRESRDYSLTHLDELVSSVNTPAGLSKAVCLRYYQNLRYKLSSRYQEGLKTYYHFLYTMGEIPHQIKTLKFVDYQRELQLAVK